MGSYNNFCRRSIDYRPGLLFGYYSWSYRVFDNLDYIRICYDRRRVWCTCTWYAALKSLFLSNLQYLWIIVMASVSRVSRVSCTVNPFMISAVSDRLACLSMSSRGQEAWKLKLATGNKWEKCLQQLYQFRIVGSPYRPPTAYADAHVGLSTVAIVEKMPQPSYPWTSSLVCHDSTSGSWQMQGVLCLGSSSGRIRLSNAIDTCWDRLFDLFWPSFFMIFFLASPDSHGIQSTVLCVVSIVVLSMGSRLD